MKRFLIAAMALATIVSCSKDDAGDSVLTSSKKAISITIANGVSSTRAVAEVTPTPGGGAGKVVDQEANQKAASTDELTVLFANNAGNVIEAYSFRDADVTTTANPDAKPDAQGVYTYTYHAVSESVTQVAVVRYADYTITDNKNDFVGKNLSEFANAAAVEDLVVDLDALDLYGASDIETDGTTCKVKGTSKDGHETTYEYKLYTATVNVIPALARVEIASISCDDLGVQTTAADTDPTKTGGYDELALKSIVWGSSDAAKQYTYTFTADDVLMGIHAKNHTARDLVSYGTTGKAIAWNVAPNATVPSNDVPMVLTMEADAYDHKVNSPTKTLSIVGFNEGIKTFERSKIYRMNINFNEENLDESNEAICVEVTVKVANWVVEEVTPVFGNN